MGHIRDKGKQLLRKFAGRQKQQNVQPVAPSTTGSSHVQPEESRDGSPSPSSAISQQLPAALWDRAYDALAKKMPGLVKDYNELLAKEEQMANSAPSETNPSQLPAPHDLDISSDRSSRQLQLNTVIRNGLQRMEDNKTTYNIAGSEFVLEDQIAKATTFLLWGKKWIDSAVKASPEASLVWSGVCLILPLLTNPVTAAEAIRDGFAYVTCRMRYYVALEAMLRRLGQNNSVDEAAILAANDHIVDLYQVILEFQLSSVLRFYQSRLRTAIYDTITSKDWRKTRRDIKMREETVNSDLFQINGLVARQELERLNKTSEDTRASVVGILSSLREPPAAQEVAHVSRMLAVEHRKCLELLFLTQKDNGVTYSWYKDSVKDRVEGTCNWFLQHGHFQKWLSQESGPLLVSADPGCGKSVLAKYLIDHELANQSATICYFFFKDQDQNTICQALCALLHQLFWAKPALIQHAMDLYHRMKAALVRSETSLWTILRDVLRDPLAGPVIFVIDALDECDDLELSGLIKSLANIFCDQQLANAKFKVLMTSRPYEHVVSEFSSLQNVFPHIHISGEDKFDTIGQEINSVIHHRVEQLGKRHRLSDKIKSSLRSKLLAIDHRTYLWVHLVFDFLEKGFEKTNDGIDAAIQTLPNSVNQAYDQMLNRSQEKETVQAVKKALSIILAANRPLKLSEMNIAMALTGQRRGRSIDELDLEQDKEFKSRLRTLCGLFVNVHHDKVYLIHQTAREFLIQSSTPAPTTVSSNLQWHRSISTRHAHSILAEVCLFYLDMLNSTQKKKFSEDTHQGALFHYSVEYWDDHCREAELEKGSAVVDLASELCSPDLTSPSQWASIVAERYHTRPELSKNVLVASHLGLTPVTELLLSRSADIEVKDSQGRTALMLAAESGYGAVIRLLLGSGANVEARDSDGRTALINTARLDRKAITQLLLENAADIDARDDAGNTALIYAARLDRKAITELLLQNGADADARGDDDNTALTFAARFDREPFIRLLLGGGASVEARDGNGRTALILAAEFDREAIARLLLENGANVEARDDDGRTALMLAAQYGHEAVTRLLLTNGADVKAKQNKGRTALLYAADSGHEAVTRLLLDNGADIEARDDNGWTGLIYATDSGHEAVTRLLLEHGADVEASDDDGNTALAHAASLGREAIKRLLLEKGADFEVEENKVWTAPRPMTPEPLHGSGPTTAPRWRLTISEE